MTARYVSLPAVGRQVSLRAYVAAIRLAKAHPAATFKHGLDCWYSCTGADIMRQFRSGLHERISAGSYRDAFHPLAPRGRKDSRDWFMRAWRDARRCRDIAKRIVVRQFETAEARRRLGHLLTVDCD